MTIAIDPLLSWMYKTTAALAPVANATRTSLALAPGEVLDVVVSANGTGYVQVRDGAGGPIRLEVIVAAGATQTCGPYNVSTNVIIEARGYAVGLNVARLND